MSEIIPGYYNKSFDEIVDEAKGVDHTHALPPIVRELINRAENLTRTREGIDVYNLLNEQTTAGIEQLSQALYNLDDPECGLEVILQTYNDAELDLDQFVRSEVFESWRVENDNDLRATDPERYARMEEAAQNGADGSTHEERIDDMVDAVYYAQEAGHISDAAHTRLLREITEVRRFHEREETIGEQVG